MPIKSRHGGSVSTRRIGANSGVPAARLAPAAHTSPTAHPPQGSRPTRPHTPHTHYPRCPTPAAPTRAHRPSSAVSPVPFLSCLRTCTHRPLSRRFSRTCALTARTVLHRMTDPMPRSPAAHTAVPPAPEPAAHTTPMRPPHRPSPRRSSETAGFRLLCKAIQTLWSACRT